MKNLVRRNYIHTLEYSARSMLCGWWLKVLGGRDGAASLKTLSNNSDAALTSLRGVRNFFLVSNLDVFWFSPKGILFPLGPKEPSFQRIKR